MPDIKGYCQERDGASKKWKKRFFLLRASGLYFSTKSESEAPADLQCYAKFDEVDTCIGDDEHQKQYKSPTGFVIVFKPRIRKQTISAAQLKCLACPDEASFNMWSAGIRLAKFGTQLKENFDSTTRKFRELVKAGLPLSFSFPSYLHGGYYSFISFVPTMRPTSLLYGILPNRSYHSLISTGGIRFADMGQWSGVREGWRS